MHFFISDFVPVSLDTCSNIKDNPIHETKQDILIGVQHIVHSRRAKFIAISTLTNDFLDTTGEISTVEGSFENQNLLSFITSRGLFDFQNGHSIGSTFIPPVRSEFETKLDYKYRFMQYVRTYNDRASYSLACVLDGVCPVNFLNQTLL